MASQQQFRLQYTMEIQNGQVYPNFAMKMQEWKMS